MRSTKVANDKLKSGKPEINKMVDNFRKLSKAAFDEQVKVFSLRYIYLLEEDGYAEVKDVAKEFAKYCRNGSELELADPQTSRFLEDAGHEFVSQMDKERCFAAIDIDDNRRISLIEYLLFRYKPDILTDYYNRVGQPHRIPEDEELLYGVVEYDTGYALISELMIQPAFGIDNTLDRMTRSIEEDKLKLEQEIKKLQEQLATSTSNVVRKAAEQRLRIIAEQGNEGQFNENDIEIKRRGNKIRADQKRTLRSYDNKEAAEADPRVNKVRQTVAGNGEPPLPDGWKKYLDDDSGRFYYYHEPSGTTQWERPEY